MCTVEFVELERLDDGAGTTAKQDAGTKSLKQSMNGLDMYRKRSDQQSLEEHQRLPSKRSVGQKSRLCRRLGPAVLSSSMRLRFTS